MKKELKDNMIPVKTEDNNIWYLDISNLTLSELIKLKKELLGKSIVSIRPLDAVIHQNANTTYEESNFYKRENEKRKLGYRNSKVLIKMKRRGR